MTTTIDCRFPEEMKNQTHISIEKKIIILTFESFHLLFLNARLNFLLA